MTREALLFFKNLVIQDVWSWILPTDLKSRPHPACDQPKKVEFFTKVTASIEYILYTSYAYFTVSQAMVITKKNSQFARPARIHSYFFSFSC